MQITITPTSQPVNLSPPVNIVPIQQMTVATTTTTPVSSLSPSPHCSATGSGAEGCKNGGCTDELPESTQLSGSRCDGVHGCPGDDHSAAVASSRTSDRGHHYDGASAVSEFLHLSETESAPSSRDRLRYDLIGGDVTEIGQESGHFFCDTDGFGATTPSPASEGDIVHGCPGNSGTTAGIESCDGVYGCPDTASLVIQCRYDRQHDYAPTESIKGSECRNVCGCPSNYQPSVTPEFGDMPGSVCHPKDKECDGVHGCPVTGDSSNGKECDLIQGCPGNEDPPQSEECDGIHGCPGNADQSKGLECDGVHGCPGNEDQSKGQECDGVHGCPGNEDQSKSEECDGVHGCPGNEDPPQSEECDGIHGCPGNEDQSKDKECDGVHGCPGNADQSKGEECDGVHGCPGNEGPLMNHESDGTSGCLSIEDPLEDERCDRIHGCVGNDKPTNESDAHQFVDCSGGNTLQASGLGVGGSNFAQHLILCDIGEHSRIAVSEGEALYNSNFDPFQFKSENGSALTHTSVVEGDVADVFADLESSLSLPVLSSTVDSALVSAPSNPVMMDGSLELVAEGTNAPQSDHSADLCMSPKPMDISSSESNLPVDISQADSVVKVETEMTDQRNPSRLTNADAGDFSAYCCYAIILLHASVVQCV